MSIFKDQWDFMQLGKQTHLLPIGPGAVHTDAGKGVEQISLYAKLVAEETGEFFESLGTEFDGHIASDIKEAVDILVVTAGYLITRLGVDGAQQAWNFVHETNLAKVRGGAEKREDGKIMQNREYKEKLKAQLMQDLEDLFI